MDNRKTTARVHYTGTLEDGTVFDTSVGGEPLEFTFGEHMVIKGFEEAVASMVEGERKQVVIPCKDAYGYYDDGKIEAIPMLSIPHADQFKVGEQTYLFPAKDMPIACKLLKIENGIGFFDFNLPLAGKDLTFDIHLLALS